MEDFIVSARKYRPTTFDSVVGQTPITDTLKNAIKSNHLAQAFLFTGPRGVGKTTCARILAKTINCFSITQEIEACDECESCKSFDEGRSLNIYELDAASNNSVEDIRNLIEQVRFAPQLGTHKVYIIDEVHMLSQAAFNAFLKTLEEPPKHAIFILATTEKHKIIPTILSRCQVFDFSRIQIEDIATLLSDIAGKESVTAEPDGLHIIAQKADGALRDALSMFDQIVSFSGSKITYQNVIENLNILDYDYYFKVTNSILTKDISNCLLVFNEILNHGFDGHNFVNGLSEHFRNLLVCQDENTVNLLEVGASIKDKYKDQAHQADLNDLVAFLNITSQTDTQYKSSKNQRLLVEVMLMQLCSLGNDKVEKKNAIINLVFRTPTKSIEKPEVKQIQPVYEKPKTEPLQVKEKETVYDNQEKETPKKTKVSLKGMSNLSFSDSISITPTKKEAVDSNIAIEDFSNRPTEEFSKEGFMDKWNDFKIILQEKGRSSLATVFENLPEINDSSVIVTMENKALEDDFNAQKTDVLDFLRKELNNYNIQISTIVNKDISAKKAYTPQEKFEKMREKNPALDTLKQKLDMDVDYA
jgi:DNA polymerase III subunit gamma/tau